MDVPLKSDPMRLDELRRRAENIQWFHTMELGDGVVTKGANDPRSRLPLLGIPDDLRGKRVLDIGAWDGFYSFECERRGADEVLATDSFCWSGEGWGTRDGFQLAHEVYRSQVKTMEIDVLKMTPEAIGQFDVVLLLGVLYHMKHPLLCLEKAAAVTRGLLILETQMDLLNLKRPAMAFYEQDELNADSTNWCGPNPSCVLAMLRTVGFSNVIIHSGAPSLPVRMFRAAYRKMKHGGGFLHEIHRDRMVFHARKTPLLA